MGFRVEFDDGQSVEFDSQPSPADIEEAHTHLKANAAPQGQSQAPQEAPQQPEQGFMAGVKGVGAGLGDIAAGVIKFPAQVALAGMGKLSGDDWETARAGAAQAMEETYPSLGSGGANQTPAYQAMMKPFDLLGQGIETAGNAYGDKFGRNAGGAAKFAMDVGSAALPLHLLPKGIEAIAKRVDPALKETPKAPTGSAKLDALDAMDKAPATPAEAPVQGEQAPTTEYVALQREKLQLQSGKPTPESKARIAEIDSNIQRLNLELYQQKLKEQQAAQQSAFNPQGDVGRERPVGDMTQQEMFGPAFDLAHEGESAPRELPPELTKQGELFGSGMDLQHNGELAPRQLPVELSHQPDMFGPGLDLEHSGDMAPKEPSRPLTDANQGDLFPPETNMHRAFTDTRLDNGTPEGRPMTFQEYTQTIHSLAKEPGTRFEVPANMKEGYQNYLEHNRPEQAGMFDVGTRAEAFAESNRLSQIPKQVENHPLVKAADNRVTKQAQIIMKLQMAIDQGHPMATQLVRAMKDLKGLEDKATTVRDNITTALKNREGDTGKSQVNPFGNDTVNMNSGIPFTKEHWEMVKAGARSLVNKGKGINLASLAVGARSAKTLANGYKLLATGIGDGLKVEAFKNGQRVGGVSFDKTNKWDAPEINTLRAPMVGVDEAHRGNNLSVEMYKFAHSLGNDIIPSQVLRPGGQAIWAKLAASPDGAEIGRAARIKGQGGAVNLSGSLQGVKDKINQMAHLAGDTATKMSDFIKHVTTLTYKSDRASRDFLANSHSETINAADKFAKPMDPDAVIAKILAPGSTDLPSMNILSRSLQSGMDLMASKFKEHPLMVEASRVLTYAAAKTQLQIRTLVNPLEKIYSSLPTKDMIEVQGALKKEQMRNAPYTEDQLRGAGFNEKQIQAYKMQRDAYKTALDVQNKSRALLGMDPVTKLDQYYSSVWHGNWHMPIFKDKMDASGKPIIDTATGKPEQVLAWYIRTTTKSEANKALAYLKANNTEKLNLNNTKSVFRGSKSADTGPTDPTGAYHDMQKFFDGDPNASKTIQDLLSSYLKDQGYGLTNQSKHFIAKGNIRGFEGDRPWLSDKENAYNGAHAQVGYLKNALRWSNHQEAIANVKKVLSNPDVATKMPNAVEYAHTVLAHEAGNSPAVTAALENSLAQFLRRSRSNLTTGIGDLKTGMYLQSLGLNAAYALATPLQYGATGPMWHAVLSDAGYKTGIAGGAKTIALSLSDASAGVLSHMAHELGMPGMRVPMTEIGRQALQYAEDAGIVSRNLFDESGGIGEHAVMTGVKNTLGWTIGFPEKVARMNAFMGFVHHLNESGKFGNAIIDGKSQAPKELFRLAEEYTGRAMTSFMSHDRPQVVANLGSLGQLGYVYKSYVFNQAHTINAAARMAIPEMPTSIVSKIPELSGGRGNPLPLAALIGGYTLMAGVVGIPLVNEMDGLWNATKDVYAKYFPEAYVKHDMVNSDLKASLIKMLPETSGFRSVLQKGLPSATIGAIRGDSGPDLGTHLSAQILDTEHPTNNIPGAAPAQEVKEWGSVLGMAYHQNKDAAWSALHANAFPWLKGQLENNVSNFSQGAGTNNQLMYKPDELNSAKTMEHRRTLEDQSYRGMGLTSFAEAQDKRNIYRTNEDEMRNNTALAKLKEYVAHGIKDMGNGGEEQAAKALVAYKTLNPSANINDVIKSAGMSVYTTPLEQKELNMRSIRMMQYYQRYAGQPK